VKKPMSLALILLLQGVSLRAALIAPVESAPLPLAPSVAAAPTLSVSAAPSLLAALPSAAPAMAAAPASPIAAALPAPALIPAAAASVPAAEPAAEPAALSAAAPASAPALRDGASEGAFAAASLFFDRGAAAQQPLSDFIKVNASRPLGGGVFIQQEHEGSLLSPDPRDSSGNVFRYYRPIEMRPELAAEVDRGLKGFSKLIYSVSRALQIHGRGTPEGAWRAWPTSAKLDYLDKLEKAVAAERGPKAAWDGKVSLIMERRPDAPDFVARNPHMEAPPSAYRGVVGSSYLQPEIVSAKETPAASVDQALGRAGRVIADTGHAGVQFHVFVKAAPSFLLDQMSRLDGALQLVNDVLFAQAAADSEQNISHPSLGPWHGGRSERVRALISNAGADPHVPAAEDPDSEKHAFVGLRYWGKDGSWTKEGGLEPGDGKAVVSFELRGAAIPWKKSSNGLGRGVEASETPRRDYAPIRATLTYLSVYAEALARGEAPRAAATSVVLNEAAADAMMRERARTLGVPDPAYDGLAAFARRLTGAASVPQGYLFPFAASAPDSAELKNFADSVVVLAARLKATEDAGRQSNLRQDRFEFWSAYRVWARRFGARRGAQLEDLARASVR
jgi:hypothetical protein